MADITGQVRASSKVNGRATMPHTGTLYHDLLKNRELPGQHPISAITGLEDLLNDLAAAIRELKGTPWPSVPSAALMGHPYGAIFHDGSDGTDVYGLVTSEATMRYAAAGVMGNTEDAIYVPETYTIWVWTEGTDEWIDLDGSAEIENQFISISDAELVWSNHNIMRWALDEQKQVYETEEVFYLANNTDGGLPVGATENQVLTWKNGEAVWADIHTAASAEGVEF